MSTGVTTPQTAPAKPQRRIAVQPLQAAGSAPPPQKPSEPQGQALHAFPLLSASDTAGDVREVRLREPTASALTDCCHSFQADGSVLQAA